MRRGRSLGRAAVRHELRGALPIATSAGAPAALLLLAWAEPLDADLVLALALALVDLRLALLGSVVRGSRGSAVRSGCSWPASPWRPSPLRQQR